MTSADLATPKLPAKARLKRSDSSCAAARKLATSSNHGKDIRPLMDLIPASIGSDPEAMYQSLLSTYQPQGVMALQCVRSLSHVLVELDMFQNYRMQVLQGQSQQQIAFSDLEAVLAQSMTTSELDTVRKHQEQINQEADWDDGKANWAAQILIECASFKRALDWWAGCSDEDAASQRFPLICQQLYQRVPSDSSPLATFYGLGMQCPNSPRLHEAIGQIWAEANRIQVLWPHRVLIRQAQTTIRARMIVDDGLLQKLDSLIQARQTQIRRLERDLKRYGCVPTVQPQKARLASLDGSRA